MGAANLFPRPSLDSERTPLTSHRSHSEESASPIPPERPSANGLPRAHILHPPEKDSYIEHDKPLRATCPLAVMASVLALALCLFLLLFELSGFVASLMPNAAQDDSHDDPAQLFDNLNRYIFKNYDSQTPFSDFLPGLAGIYGKPLYAFFVNRGQGIASFGIESKHYPIMEYFPADRSYQNTPLVGFRTFVQGKRRNSDPFVIEPFSPLTTHYPATAAGSTTTYPKRIMYTGGNELQIQEIDSMNHLETNVTYFVLPEEDFGAFVRRTTISNTHPKESVTLSILDGLTHMQPYGGEGMDDQLKSMSNTLGAWMRVKFPYEDSIDQPFYRLTTEVRDSESVKVLKRGHYCMAVMEDLLENPTGNNESNELLPIVYDTEKVFGEDTTLLRPVQLFSKSVADIVREPQYGSGKSSSCFAAVREITLEPGETATISTFYGGAANILDLPEIARRVTQPGFVLYKLTRSRELIKQITASVETKTGNKLFDEHVKQMYLDNSLRGGIPVILGDVDDDGLMNVDEDPQIKVFHAFSRDYGDLERDRNNFMLSPTFFSQASCHIVETFSWGHGHTHFLYCVIRLQLVRFRDQEIFEMSPKVGATMSRSTQKLVPSMYGPFFPLFKLMGMSHSQSKQ
jgi:hypothetical protein